MCVSGNTLAYLVFSVYETDSIIQSKDDKLTYWELSFCQIWPTLFNQWRASLFYGSARAKIAAPHRI